MPEDIIGKNYFDYIVPENATKSREIFNEAIKQKKPINNLENWILHKNGDKICIRTNCVPLFDESGNVYGYRGVNTEITIEKEAEVKIKELNTKFLDLKTEISELLTENKKDKGMQTIEITPKINDEKKDENDLDSIYIFDENANILDCNENMYKKLGYSKNEMLSLNITDFDALETQQDLKEKINQAKKNGNYSFKTIHRRKDGSTVPVYEVFEYIKDKNAFKCIVKEDYPLRKSY